MLLHGNRRKKGKKKSALGARLAAVKPCLFFQNVSYRSELGTDFKIIVVAEDQIFGVIQEKNLGVFPEHGICCSASSGVLTVVSVEERTEHSKRLLSFFPI
jgi:hypothetical protein